MEIGAEIRRIRKGKGISQKDMAKGMGISQTYLSHIEKGRREGSISILFKASEVLGVNLFVVFFLSLEEGDALNGDLFKRFNPILKDIIEGIYIS